MPERGREVPGGRGQPHVSPRPVARDQPSEPAETRHGLKEQRASRRRGCRGGRKHGKAQTRSMQKLATCSAQLQEAGAPAVLVQAVTRLIAVIADVVAAATSMQVHARMGSAASTHAARHAHGRLGTVDTGGRVAAAEVQPPGPPPLTPRTRRRILAEQRHEGQQLHAQQLPTAPSRAGEGARQLPQPQPAATPPRKRALGPGLARYNAERRAAVDACTTTSATTTATVAGVQAVALDADQPHVSPVPIEGGPVASNTGGQGGPALREQRVAAPQPAGSSNTTQPSQSTPDRLAGQGQRRYMQQQQQPLARPRTRAAVAAASAVLDAGHDGHRRRRKTSAGI